MSSARLQDTRSIYKNQLFFYTVAMTKPKNENKKNNSIYNDTKRIKYLGINLTSAKLIL